jgi:hypothetical protein
MTDILVVDHAAYMHAPQSFAGAVAADSRCRVERRGLLIPNYEYEHRSLVVDHLWSSIVGQSVYPLFLFPNSTIGRWLSTLLRSSIVGQWVVFFSFSNMTICRRLMDDPLWSSIVGQLGTPFFLSGIRPSFASESRI